MENLWWPPWIPWYWYFTLSSRFRVRTAVSTSLSCGRSALAKPPTVMKNLIIRRPFHVTSNKACLNVRPPYVRPSVDLSTKRFPTYGTWTKFGTTDCFSHPGNNPNHVLHRLLPNLKTLITIYVNALAILLYRWTSMPLWSKTLFIDWFSSYWFFTERSLLFYEICFTQRHLLILPNLCVYSFVACAFVICY